MSFAGNQKHTRKMPVEAAGAVCLVAAVFLVCYLLSTDDSLPWSISAVWEAVEHFFSFLHIHLVTVGLLPVYVALMIFGGAFAGAFVGYVFFTLLRWLKRLNA